MLLSKRHTDRVFATLIAHQRHQAEDRDLDQQNQPVARISQLVHHTPPATARACTIPVTMRATRLSWATRENRGISWSSSCTFSPGIKTVARARSPPSQAQVASTCKPEAAILAASQGPP